MKLVFYKNERGEENIWRACNIITYYFYVGASIKFFYQIKTIIHQTDLIITAVINFFLSIKFLLLKYILFFNHPTICSLLYFVILQL